MNRDEAVKRLKELGWEDVTQREMKLTDDEDFEDGLFMAFEHSRHGVRYLYSEEGLNRFLKRAEEVWRRENQ